MNKEHTWSEASLIVTHLFHGDVFVNDCLVPFRIQALLHVFSPPLVLDTESEQREQSVSLPLLVSLAETISRKQIKINKPIQQGSTR